MQKKLLYLALCATMAYAEPFSQLKFIPDISLIVDGSYVNRNMEDAEVQHLGIPNVAHGILGTHSHGGLIHAPFNANNGFNINYAELVLSSDVDPFLTLDGVFHYSPNGVEIEEVYATSTALENGLRVKGGKFLSNFGYLNEHHQHTWTFSDMPLVYEGFLGSHGINEIGLQLQWTPPTDTYIMLGAEVLQGDNQQMFGNKQIGEEDNVTATGATAPSLFVLYAKSSFDIGETTVLGGVSFANGSSRIDHTQYEEPSAFSGISKLYGADLIIKHYFDSYSALTFQGEWLYRNQKGIKYDLTDDTTQNLDQNQAGYYAQLAYSINQNYATAMRYDNIYQNGLGDKHLDKYSVMVEYKTSEFARFRLQYNQNNSLFNEVGDRQKINSLIAQVNIAIGAHGAHAF